MKIIDTFEQISSMFEEGRFSLDRWKEYLQRAYPDALEMCLRDMEECVATGQVTWEDDYLPVLNAVWSETDQRKKAYASFLQAVDGLEERIIAAFGRAPQTEIVLYAGLCNGAGWVRTIGERTVILLGLEKIMELRWNDPNSMIGLIWHELGHVYQAQFGMLHRKTDDRRLGFIWQLFTEGVAMCFEQALAGSDSYYHQDRDGWKNWCDAHFDQIRHDFNADLAHMSRGTQRWFGDWVRYEGHGDVGYYLGARFVQFIRRRYSFDELIGFDLDSVEALYQNFIAST